MMSHWNYITTILTFVDSRHDSTGIAAIASFQNSISAYYVLLFHDSIGFDSHVKRNYTRYDTTIIKYATMTILNAIIIKPSFIYIRIQQRLRKDKIYNTSSNANKQTIATQIKPNATPHNSFPLMQLYFILMSAQYFHVRWASLCTNDVAHIHELCCSIF